MSQMSGPSHLPPGPSPVKVPLRGASGRLAALLVAGATVVVVGIALLGQGGDRPPGLRAAVEGPTATPTSGPTPEHASVPWPGSMPAWTPAAEPAVRGRALPTGGTPLPDFAHALPGDAAAAPLPLGTIDDVPNADRLDFLFELDSYRDAHWIDPRSPTLGSGVWTAGRPFHVREGFINNREEPLGAGFGVVLYVTRMGGDPDEPTYRYEPDYVLRGKSDRCGPTYETQAGPETCEWFVHDFPEGLPEGRFAIWAVWEAPCGAWVDLGLAVSCRDPEAVISLFSSGFDAPYGRSEPEYETPR
jgi:hypothetical protein